VLARQARPPLREWQSRFILHFLLLYYRPSTPEKYYQKSTAAHPGDPGLPCLFGNHVTTTSFTHSSSNMNQRSDRTTEFGDEMSGFVKVSLQSWNRNFLFKQLSRLWISGDRLKHLSVNVTRCIFVMLQPLRQQRIPLLYKSYLYAYTRQPHVESRPWTAVEATRPLTIIWVISLKPISMRLSKPRPGFDRPLDTEPDPDSKASGRRVKSRCLILSDRLR
jgi:hypothetical protein